ncbi:hypothetical protein PUNSTDRAFT_52954 [Punctularia strigosozonata HHB-11173 SS5]|uniref:uncharacterized protein n=1 Tax=Punctularia strigosozonata (strain HHB-11173) TaxID=741275 RepID=UPI0004417BA2|nr:uncharacterized protein PUNSTDRAFT_52954 [Punctularia strigosozonata HHB-11173 SS5]EIN08624.1 hypothetical protein PUNSTDRAFT_52954 [Punctularia strigosozonata HHB-11173 SS5]
MLLSPNPPIHSHRFAMFYWFHLQAQSTGLTYVVTMMKSTSALQYSEEENTPSHGSQPPVLDGPNAFTSAPKRPSRSLLEIYGTKTLSGWSQRTQDKYTR